MASAANTPTLDPVARLEALAAKFEHAARSEDGIRLDPAACAGIFGDIRYVLIGLPVLISLAREISARADAQAAPAIAVGGPAT